MAEQKTPIMIVGTGADARVALDIANSLDILVYGFLTDKEEEILQQLNDILIISSLESTDGISMLKEDKVLVVVAERDIELRRKMTRKVLKHRKELGELLHPSAMISAYAELGQNLIVNAGTVIGPNAKIGNHNLIQARVSIEADVELGAYCTIQSGACIGQGAKLGKKVFVGAGAVILAGLNIGDGAMIAAGAVVMKSVPEKNAAIGNPAEIRTIDN